MNKTPSRPNSVTSFDVAQLAGVSRSAVSRTYTKGASVSEKTRKKVEEAANILGYRVNMVASGLNKRRTDLVGMIASAMETPYRAMQIDALAKQLVAEGFRPMLFCIDDIMGLEDLINILLNYKVSGVIITSDAPPAKICEECARMHVPLVLIDRIDDLSFVDKVNGNNLKGGQLAAKTLIDAGRTNLIVVETDKMGYSGLARIESFIDYAATKNIIARKVFIPEIDYFGGSILADELISERHNKLGVFCPSDQLALGFLDNMRNKYGVKIPEEISLIGYDDIPQSSWTFADLTTIKQSPQEFARVSIETLKARINAPEQAPVNRIIDVKLIMRSTV